jgi:nitroreductase
MNQPSDTNTENYIYSETNGTLMTVTTDLLVQQLNWRYAVKKFDASRKIAPEIWQTLEQALVLSPSSYGLQPWRFLVITDPEIKSQLPAISWNQNQPMECSHMVVLAVAERLDEAYVDEHIQQIADTRGIAAESMGGYRKMLVSTISATETHLDWNARQVYLALGQLMTSAAMLGVDSCPMEGIQAKEYDRLLGLEGSGYCSTVGCALGYRDPSDPIAKLKKVRFSPGEVVQHF